MHDPDLDGIVPYIPFYLADGNTVVDKWDEIFVGKFGETAKLYKLTYRNKKGKISDPIIYRVEWKS